MLRQQKSTSKTGVEIRPKCTENSDFTGFSALSTGLSMWKNIFPHVFLACGKRVEVLDTIPEPVEIKGFLKACGKLTDDFEVNSRAFECLSMGYPYGFPQKNDVFPRKHMWKTWKTTIQGFLIGFSSLHKLLFRQPKE